MNWFKANLHTHTVLSPCGSLEMSPVTIVEKAKIEGIDILGITDHNSTLMCEIMQNEALNHNIFVLPGCEVNTKEEIHCLAFFETKENLDKFQDYIDKHIPMFENDPEKFGHQVVVNRDEEILQTVDHLLLSAINQTIEQVEKKVHELDGLFIPAHIDRSVNSILSQLGFIPPDLKFDALELSKFAQLNQYIGNPVFGLNTTFIQSSDAHFIENMGDACSKFYLEKPSFNEIKMALHSKNNRKAELY